MITQGELKELFYYDGDTGLFTRRSTTSWRSLAGTIAGSLTSTGYMVIKINYQSYYAHRLAWLYVNGEFPVDRIDHINRVRTDNRIVNIRETTASGNARNLTPRANGTGVTGVSVKKSGLYCAYIGLPTGGKTPRIL